MEEDKPNIFRRICNILRQTTVEPVTLLLIIGSLLASTTTQTLALEKACRVNLNLSEAICDAMRNQDTDDNAENEKIIQEYVARLIAYKSIITSVLPCILLVFTGGWMDATGRRKIIMLLSVSGDILVQINNLVNVIFFYQIKVEYLLLLDGFFSSIFGGWAILFLAVFSYIVDITTETNRTWRVGLINFAVFSGMPIGITLSGILLKNFGYLTVYIVTLSMACLNAFYIIFILRDPKRTKEHKLHDNRGFFYFLKIFFNPAHLLNSLKVLFRKTADNRALRLCIMLGATCFLFGPMYGESAVIYMATRYRFGWDELQYSIFQAYNTVLNIIGTMFCILVMIKALGCHDAVLGIMSTSSKIASSFIYAFATSGTIFYLGPIADLFNGTAFIAMRSLFSKNVASHEIGKLNSIVGIFEVIMPLAYVPVYTRVYTATMEVMPGFVFLLGTFLTIPTLLVFVWLFIRHLRAVKLQKTRETPEEAS